MKCIVRVEVRLKKGFHDPEGVTALSCLRDLGFKQIVDVKSGKVYYLTIEAQTKEDVLKIAEQACTKLLSNPVKDEYNISIIECTE